MHWRTQQAQPSSCPNSAQVDWNPYFRRRLPRCRCLPSASQEPAGDSHIALPTAQYSLEQTSSVPPSSLHIPLSFSHHWPTKHAQAATDDRLTWLVDQSLSPGAPVWQGHHLGVPPKETPLPDSEIQDYSDKDAASKALDLATSQRWETLLQLVSSLVQLQRTKALHMLPHKGVLRAAAEQKKAHHALAYYRALPYDQRFHSTTNLALQVCAAARDLDSATALLEAVRLDGRQPDVRLLTTYIKVCKSVGQADKAYQVYLDIKRRHLPVDAHVLGALVAAFAEAMRRELTVVHERRDQYVLLERATTILQEAQEAGVRLNTVPWNSLLVCAGRCGQLKRAFDVLEQMQAAGQVPDVFTYGGLMEACVQAGRHKLALRLFDRAISEASMGRGYYPCRAFVAGLDKGLTQHVELYTTAVSACQEENGSRQGLADLDRALEVYNCMQRQGVAPDKKFFAALIAVAGKADRLHQAFEILTDVAAERLWPGATICSALIHSCLVNQQYALARQVFDLCAAKGVYPELSQFNRLMDWYAGERRFGDVVSLLTDMTQRAMRTPNLNTYRVLLNACQRADQGALAFEVFALMKANKVPVLQE
ncbi:hypothetical protein QJQ45_023772, partial [Haematococcus lacustris]